MNVGQVIPASGFIKDYMEYATQLTDAPEIFHAASCLAVLSAAFSHYVEIFVPMGDSGKVAWTPVNVWVLITGKSGDRKSTALDMAVDMAGDAVRERIGGIGTSPESTWDLIAAKPDTFFAYSEGAQFFGQFFAPYWKHGQGIFPMLYDGRDVVRDLTGERKKKSNKPTPTYRIEIKRPRVTVAVAVALDHLDTARTTDWTGGLIGRMLMVHAERTTEKEMRLYDYAQEAKLRTWMVNASMALRKKMMANRAPTKLDMTPEARKMYFAWVSKVSNKVHEISPKMQALYNRMSNHVLRISGLYALSMGKLVIGVEAMEPAIRLANDAAFQAIDFVGDLLSDDRVHRMAIKIHEYVRSFNGPYVSANQVCASLKIAYSTLVPAIRSLQLTGKVRIFTSNDTTEVFLATGPETKTLIPGQSYKVDKPGGICRPV